MEDKRKPDLFILLGAGSSIGVGAPSTEQITKTILEMKLPKLVHHSAEVQFEHGQPIFHYPLGLPIIQQIERALRGTYRNFSFEHVVAALEDLEPLANLRYPRMDEFIPVLSGFMEFKREFEPINQTWIIQQFRHKIIRLICDCVINSVHDFSSSKAARENQALYKNFFKELRQHFTLRIFTLNYDDFIDDCLKDICGDFGYNDGFLPFGSDEASFGQFMRHKMLSSAHPENLMINGLDMLVHLHGSIRFGFAPVGAEQQQVPGSIEIVQYLDAASAFKSLEKFVSDDINNGVLIPHTPIISGFSKTEKLQERPVPFGYYLNSFVHNLLSAERVLIIGYGGRDEYINTWLRERMHVRKFTKTSGRISVINLLTGETVGARTPERSLLDQISQNDLKDAFYNPEGESLNRGKEAWVTENVQVICSGFPVNTSIQDSVVSFLSAS